MLLTVCLYILLAWERISQFCRSLVGSRLSRQCPKQSLPFVVVWWKPFFLYTSCNEALPDTTMNPRAQDLNTQDLDKLCRWILRSQALQFAISAERSYRGCCAVFPFSCSALQGATETNHFKSMRKIMLSMCFYQVAHSLF